MGQFSKLIIRSRGKTLAQLKLIGTQHVHAKPADFGNLGPGPRTLVREKAHQWRIKRDRTERTDHQTVALPGIVNSRNDTNTSGPGAQHVAEMARIDHARLPVGKRAFRQPPCPTIIRYSKKAMQRTSMLVRIFASGRLVSWNAVCGQRQVTEWSLS